MAFRDGFNQTMNKAFGHSQVSARPSIVTSGSSMEKSMRAYLPTYRDDARYGQPPEEGFEYKLRTSLLRKMYERNVVVRAAIDTIINEVVSAKFEIKPINPDEKVSPEKKSQQDKKIKEIEDFFNHPNENRESFRILLEKMMWDLLVFDAGVIEKVRNVGGDKLKEIYAIPGDTIRIKVDEHGKILGYWQVLDGTKRPPKFFKSDNIIYIVMNPRSHTPYGFSPLHTLENMVTAFLYSEHYNVKYFENNATPRGILELGAINEGQLDRFREYWRQENLQQPHRVMVVSNPHAHEGKGGIKWIPLALNAKDMELMQYLNWLMKMILMVFGVTPSEVGFADELRGAPALGQVLQSQAFKNKAIFPMMDRIARYFTEEIIVSEFGAKDLIFDFIEEQSIQEQLQKAQLDSLLIQSQIMTVEEVRKDRGLEIKKGRGVPGLEGILAGLQGKPAPGEEAVMGIENEPTIVDTAFKQLKEAVYNHLGLDESVESKPGVPETLDGAYNELKDSIEAYIGQKKTGETGSLIEDAFHRLVREIKLMTTMKHIDGILSGNR